MTIENQDDLRQLMEIGQIVGQCIQHMAAHLEAGMTTAELDAIGSEFLEKHGARSAPILAYQFPAHTCISINDEAAHGIPGERVIQPGDLVNIDVSAEKNGFWADSGRSFPVSPIENDKQKLLDTAQRALELAIKQTRAGKPINGVGKAVQRFAEKRGYFVVRELRGHGVGAFIHEKPSVPHYYEPRLVGNFEPGMVLTLEPFIAMRKTAISTAADGWTLKTNGSLVAQFEHTVVVTERDPILVTAV